MKKSFLSTVLPGLVLTGLFSCLAAPATGRAQIIPYPGAGPDIRIISHANHEVFLAPVDIPIFAFVAFAGNVTNVEFYADGTDLGPGYSLSASLNPPGVNSPDIFGGPPVFRLNKVYGFYWTNVPTGPHVLKAVATGELILSRTSNPVNITVLSATNIGTGPRVVSIVAVDPIAIAGSNGWTWPGLTNAAPAWANWPPSAYQIFTNWGPKDALFMVRNRGNTSDVFTVTYNIGGTASNGVDYAMLSGAVTFPPGKSYVLIPIVPIDHGGFYAPKTVILTLTPATNGPPPAYTVGRPACAEAVIIHAWPYPFPWLLPDGSFHLHSTGPDGAWFSIQNSSDMLNWTSLGTNQVINGSIDYTDPNAPDQSNGFYRIVPLPCPARRHNSLN